jgi:hypothetical protein
MNSNCKCFRNVVQVFSLDMNHLMFVVALLPLLLYHQNCTLPVCEVSQQ